MGKKGWVGYLLDGRIEPLVPASFALLSGFANEKGRDSSPLVLPIFHNSSLQDLIFCVLPNTTLYHNPHLGTFFVSPSILQTFDYRVLPPLQPQKKRRKKKMNKKKKKQLQINDFTSKRMYNKPCIECRCLSVFLFRATLSPMLRYSLHPRSYQYHITASAKPFYSCHKKTSDSRMGLCFGFGLTWGLVFLGTCSASLGPSLLLGPNRLQPKTGPKPMFCFW